MSATPTASPRRWTAVRVIAFAGPLVVAALAVATRWYLFTHGVLYGPQAAKMASLTVAGLIVISGYVPLKVYRAAVTPPGAGGTPGGGGQNESSLATLAAIIGLATASFGVSELLAPDTPVQAAASACRGVSVYGAPYFAVTPGVGVNARTGAGRAFPQANRYAGKCTLGFDGYCIGPPEVDRILKTPDQRWLIVHGRKELVASAVVLGQTKEAQLGSQPAAACTELHGLPQPTTIESFALDRSAARLTATAPGAVAVGYVLATPDTDRSTDKSLGLGTLAKGPGFPVAFKAADLTSWSGTSDGEAWIGASICLADSVPVGDSLKLTKITYRKRKITKTEAVSPEQDARPAALALLACNGSR